MRSKKVFPSFIWVVYILLFAFSIPWYFPKEMEMDLFLGLPLWLIISISIIIIIALFTILVIHKYWKAES